MMQGGVDKRWGEGVLCRVNVSLGMVGIVGWCRGFSVGDMKSLRMRWSGCE